MTLTFCNWVFDEDGRATSFFAMSDVMVSSGIPSKFQRPLTMNPRMGDLLKNPKFPTGMCRKLEIINNKILVGWSGSLIEARLFCESIRQNFTEKFSKDDRYKISELGREFSHIEAFVCGICSDGFFIQCVNSSPYPVDGIGIVSCLGSGSEEMLKYVYCHQTEILKARGSDSQDVQISSFFLGSAADLLASQYYVGDNFEKCWGGPFDFVIINDGKFQRLDKIIFNVISLGENKGYGKDDDMPDFSIFQWQQDDVSVFLAFKEYTFLERAVVTGIMNNLGDLSLREITLIPEISISVFRDQYDESKVFSQVDFNKNGLEFVSLEFHKKAISFKIRKGHFGHLVRLARSVISQQDK